MQKSASYCTYIKSNKGRGQQNINYFGGLFHGGKGGCTPFHQNNEFFHPKIRPLQTVPNGLKHDIKH